MGFNLMRVIKNPSLLYVYASKYCEFKWVNDKTHLKLLYKGCFGQKLDLKNPKLFNEKLQWLKLYDRKPEYVQLVDKYEVKKYISKTLGAEYVIPTVGVWDNAKDIDFDSLPDKFVLKCTHDSHSVVICTDKRKLDIEYCRKKLNQALKRNYFYDGRQWPYKNVKPRIIAEQYMADNLRNYKQFCFESAPRMILVCSERLKNNEVKEDFYNEAWNHLDAHKLEYNNSNFSIQRPKQYELIRELTIKLAEKIPSARIDFYEINEKTYFGEITFYSTNGFEKIKPEEWNLEFGEWIKLPGKGGYKLNSDCCSIIISDSRYNNKIEKSINDYKFFCFDGEVDSIMVCTGREKGHPDFYFYDENWNRLYYQHSCLEKSNDVEKPCNLDEMLKIAKILSKGFSHIRVDLFDVDGNVYFGELTFFDNSGFDVDISHETDLKWGEKINLPNY